MFYKLSVRDDQDTSTIEEQTEEGSSDTVNVIPDVVENTTNISIQDDSPAESDDDSKPNPIPFITHTEEVGPGGATINVGDCFIEFQPGTFAEYREVTVTAKIDSSEWPEGDEVITPTLDVKSGNIQKPAKVRLPTWITPDDEEFPNVQILHFSDDKWNVIQTLQLRYSRFIEFQCDSFSLVLARIVGPFSMPLSITFQPTLFIHRHTFVTAFHLQDVILSHSIYESIKRQFKNEPDQIIERSPMTFKLGDKVEISLECNFPKSGFDFDPLEHFSRSIGRWLLSGNIPHERFVLRSHLEAQDIIIHFKATKEGAKTKPDSVEYYWNPAKFSGLRSPTESTGDTNPKNVFQGPVYFLERTNVGSGD